MTLLTSIFLFFAVFYFAAVLFLRCGLLSLKSGGEPHGRSFSIVIAARNEENTIGRCLESILQQTIDTNKYEIIVVNDRSTDSTADKVREFIHVHKNVSLIDISETPDGVSPKKYAVGRGVSAAKNEVIVYTDADCVVSQSWLETIDRYFTDDTGFVQGITTYGYLDGMNRMFYGLQTVDFLSHGIISAAGIGSGMPINSNANNLAFSKKAFGELGGYSQMGGNVVSGDDDLLLQKIWRSKKWKIRFFCDSSGAVSTLPTKTVSGVFEQRKRWGSKTVHYNPLQIIFLSGIFLFYVSVLVSFGLAFLKHEYIFTFLIMFLVKLTGEFLLMWPGTKMFNRLDLRKFIIPGSIVQLPLVIFAVLLGVMGKFVWKEQKFTRTVSVNK
ncbi:MAG: glycosyltransferase [Fibrobacter sp.]|nr:glycosyltransferase [Fibrobacter sp.]